MRSFHLIPILVLVLACGKKPAAPGSLSQQPTPEPVWVDTVSLRQSGGNETVMVTGILTSEREAKPSFKTGGIIRQVLVKEGDRVRKGQLLATLNMEEIQAQVRMASEGLEKANRDFQRVGNLFQDSAATREQFDNVSSAKTLAEQTFRIATFNQQNSSVYSPLEGHVVKVIQHEGELAGPGIPVCFILGSTGKDWVVRAGLSDREWAQCQPGDAAVVRFDAYPGKTYSAVLEELAPAANPLTGTFDALIRLKEFPPRLAAGLINTVEIQPSQRGPVSVIPVETLVTVDGESARVFVFDNGKARKREIILGRLLGDKVEVRAGLEPHDAVITTGASFIRDGQPVSIISSRQR